MHPFLKIGDTIAIPTYGMCLATGFLTSLFIYHRLRSAREMTSFSQTTRIALFLLISGFSGAALLGLLIHGIQHGISLVFYGGVIFSALLFPLFAKQTGLDIGKELDYIVIALLPGQAMGRIGCLLAGCCYGRAYDGIFSVCFSSPASDAPVNQPLIPVQLIEAICSMALFAYLYFCRYKAGKIGCAIRYLLVYATYRFFIEFLRGDNERGVLWGLSTSQWIALFIILLLTFHYVQRGYAKAVSFCKSEKWRKLK